MPAAAHIPPHQPVGATWRQGMVLLVVLCTGFALTFLAGRSLQQYEALRLQEQKAAATQAVVSAFELELTRTVEAIRNAGLMVESNPNLTRDEFDRYMRRFVANQLSVNLVEWQPIVPAAQLARFEADAQAAGTSDFRVVQPDARGKAWERVSGRDEYVPVRFAWPADYRTEGLDMSFSPERMASKRESQRSRLPVASGIFPFMKGGMVDSGAKAVAISTAVFDKDDRALGFVAAVVDLATLFQRAVRVADAAQLDVLVYGAGAKSAEPFYTWMGDGSDWKAGDNPIGKRTAGDSVATVYFGQQPWQVVLHARPAFYAALPVQIAPLAYGVGAALTLLLAFVVALHLRTNKQLMREVSSRAAVDVALQRRQAMLERTESTAHIASFEWDIDSNKVTWSAEMFKIFGRDPTMAEPNLEGQADLYTPESTKVLYAAVNEAVANGTPYTLELTAVQTSGAKRTCLVKGFPERDAGGRVVRVTGLVQDVTDQKRHEQLVQFRSKTLEMLAAGAPLATLLEAIVLGAEQLHPAMLCSIVLLDADGRHIAKSVAPSLPDSYNAALQGLAIGLGAGSCGTAAFLGERVIVADIATHPYWSPYQELAAAAGLAACWSQPISGGSGKVLGTFAIYHHTPNTPSEADIELIEQAANISSLAIERHRAQEKLSLAAGVFTHALEGIMITEPDGTIIDVNDAFTHITGFTRTEAVGQKPHILNSGRHDRAFYKSMWDALTLQGHWSGEVWNRRKDGRVFAELLTISAVRDEQGITQQYVALFSDITTIKDQQSQLEHMAHFDALTHLPNRLLLSDRLHQAMAQAQRRGQQLAVAYLDLDGFKSVNDTYGHAAGDQLLLALSSAMKDALREGDTLARIGGDEFVALFIDLDSPQSSIPLLHRLLAAASKLVQVDGATMQVSTSIGVTYYPQTTEVAADQLLRQADLAMYQAKVEGKNRYKIFDMEVDGHVRDHHGSIAAMRMALERQEFVLYYQPKVNMHTGQLVGAEALIRWQHPERGLLAPGLFLPAIETDPLGIAVGEWVLESALRQVEAWHADKLDIGISVNVGAFQLQQAGFSDRIRAALEKHPSVSPACLQLEVLETSELKDMEKVSLCLQECAAMGVSFALDDFGTGYSPLTYLKKLRVAALKIDRSFVNDMLVDPDDMTIVQAVIGLAGAFKREVIAEGVETVAQGSALLALGCTIAQGFVIARPMPADAFLLWAAQWKPAPEWSAASTPPPRQ